MVLHSCSLKQMAQCSSLMCYWCFCMVNCLSIRTRSSFWGHSNFAFVAFSLFSKHLGSNFCHTPPSSSALFICNIPLTLLLIKKNDFRMDSPGYSKKILHISRTAILILSHYPSQDVTEHSPRLHRSACDSTSESRIMVAMAMII